MEQTKLLPLQDPGEINTYNYKHVSRETNRYFRKKKREQLKQKLKNLKQIVKTRESQISVAA